MVWDVYGFCDFKCYWMGVVRYWNDVVDVKIGFFDLFCQGLIYLYLGFVNGNVV